MLYIPRNLTPQVDNDNNGTFNVTGTLAEQTITSLIVPGGLLPKVCSLHFTTTWLTTASTNNKTVRIKLNGTTFYSQVLASAASAAQTSIKVLVQRDYGSIISPSITMSTGLSKDTGANVVLTGDSRDNLTFDYTGQLSITSESITVRGSSIAVSIPSFL